ncbi:MAG: PEP/pyruvate-binding domain-containing protein [Desulfobacterales bacterium]|nr:PEP/pyruvate-binding domain-containing protein [Desulfobacterales bacterium]
MKKQWVTGIVCLSLLALSLATAVAATPDEATLHSWVQKMKTASRGPFKHIRWFCNDGTIQLPKEYACSERGGGVQHGEWNDRVKVLRENGYYIANVFADVRADEFLQDSRHVEIVKHMVLEQFLIEADNGWIFRRARYYRGALQTEDETRAGRELLLAMVSDAQWRENRFMVLREAVRFIPHGRQGAPITEMRQLSRTLAEKDPDFETLRIKLHVHPELADAQKVKEYAARQGKQELTEDYAHLADIIEQVFKAREIQKEIEALAKTVNNASFAKSLMQTASRLAPQNDDRDRFLAASLLLAMLRDNLAKAGKAEQMLAVLDASILLEGELFRMGDIMIAQLAEATRRQRLSWLIKYADGLYGIGMISARQQQALMQNLRRLMQADPQLIDYKAELQYTARMPEWADRTLRYHLGETVAHLATIEPLSLRYVHDRLRGSLLLSYAAVLESLISDANRQLGIRNFIFGQPADTGLRGLNPGLARGRLKVSPAGKAPAKFDAKGIYVLPSTTEDLPPVAGILTTGEGNILSHVQLLARNLGIPNVAIDPKWLPLIQSMADQQVVLAVSPRGIVQLALDGPQWDATFNVEKGPKDLLIRPDLKKLDLKTSRLRSLDTLRSTDSGRICGPKAANLGELKHYFPEAVAGGLVIPFGFYRQLLEQPIEPGGISAFRWMQDQYKIMQRLKGDPQRQDQVTQQFLETIRHWIVNLDPGEDFRNQLRNALQETLGPDGSYGVFVRSDTNVEDLPGFTGAGLNLTVPHVVGFDKIMAAIQRVWASPFSERAFRWRQAYMDSPEHVYASVLLMKSVPVEKSGVLVTADIENGQPGWLTVAINEGVGGAVSGQTAEELKIDMQNGGIRLLAHATDPYKRVLSDEGGVSKISASGTPALLSEAEIRHLMDFARSVPKRFPKLQDAQGRPVPADIEFGFYQNHLMLFQIRPFLESARARQNLFLNNLDSRLAQNHTKRVNLDDIPPEVQR